MSYSYFLNEYAYKEYLSAYEWYELKQDGLGEKFMLEVDKKLRQISINPLFYGKVHLNYRQVKVNHFPYLIVYEIFQRKNLIHIAAIHHHKRNHKKKYRRVGK